MSTKLSNTEMAEKLFEIGLALKLKKISVDEIEANIPGEQINKVISSIEDEDNGIYNWDATQIKPGSRLRAALEMHEISQAELARKMEVPPQKINDLIHDRLNLTVDWAKKIGKALNVSYKVFL